MITTENNLESQVHSAITNSPYITQPYFRFEAHDGKVVLRGVVKSYYHKQMAQEVLRRADGVEEIENHLEVSW